MEIKIEKKDIILGMKADLHFVFENERDIIALKNVISFAETKLYEVSITPARFEPEIKIIGALKGLLKDNDTNKM